MAQQEALHQGHTQHPKKVDQLDCRDVTAVRRRIGQAARQAAEMQGRWGVRLHHSMLSMLSAL